MADPIPQQECDQSKRPAPPPAQGPSPAELDIAARKRRAETYFNDHLSGQREWYTRAAMRNKQLTAWLAFLVLFFGSATSLIQLFAKDFPAQVSYVTAVLGVLVVLTKGLERIGKYEETWVGYRTASEGMKREFRLYINKAGDYAGIADEEETYRSFVEHVESIVADEEHQFWQYRRTGDGADGKAPAEGDAGAGAAPPAATPKAVHGADKPG
jgi:hypothetical protein